MLLSSLLEEPYPLVGLASCPCYRIIYVREAIILQVGTPVLALARSIRPFVCYGLKSRTLEPIRKGNCQSKISVTILFVLFIVDGS